MLFKELKDMRLSSKDMIVVMMMLDFCSKRNSKEIQLDHVELVYCCNKKLNVLELAISHPIIHKLELLLSMLKIKLLLIVLNSLTTKSDSILINKVKEISTLRMSLIIVLSP
jgi:hypothetical protein